MERNREKINENGKINEYITVLQGYLNGEEIECRMKGHNNSWSSIPNPTFDFSEMEYRIKPKSAYRPYITGTEAFIDIHNRPWFEWLYNTVTECYEQVICIGDNGIKTHDRIYSFNEAYDTFLYPDNKEKFGVKLDNSNEEI